MERLQLKQWPHNPPPPHVAGAAALVLSVCPNLDTAGLKAVLLDNVDPVPGLSGVTVTGGRLNVNAAIRACTDAHLTNKSFTSGTALYEAANSITADGASTVNSGASVSFISGNEIRLEPNFHALAGSYFHAVINPSIH